ncbi:hypothetical protein BD310DRAFT_974717 [Dichomitus squalens]|uniref:Uncharacterized protein n=1 Tax=Dichomitus squalens TaxID=114155 RepID=A0A4Q9Q4L2_9APHY|nr:hypothetical protein BD310DRAFT_974717 [Dichomitus squalens]
MPGSSPEDADQPESAVSPSWAPRSPLPPDRLAKLANALGVSTPIPRLHALTSPSSTYAPSPIAPPSAVSPSFDFRRSPTPSVGSSAHTYTPASQTSKYLLHVVPPSHLPHESDYTHENELLPPPPTASGYHTHFRRGVLIPVYPTLPSQLNAIAKEYALPSTVGLVLYLVNSSPAAHASMRLGNMSEEDGGPGPRISEDIWRHIWVRVLKAERDEPPLSSTRTNGLGFGNAAAQSSPSLLQDVMSNPSPLRPLLSPMRTEAPRLGTPSPSTTVSHSALSSTSGLDSPDSATSVSDGGNADDLPLPGLHSPALIPILAKVEFDIDKRKATWYGRWKKTRRAQHAKRAESRLGLRSRAASRAGDESAAEEDDLARKPALELRLVERLQAESNMPAFMRPKDGRLLGPDADDGYAQLPDSDEEDEDATARFGQGTVSGDPLADVFGTDAETWADIRAELQPFRQKGTKNPNVVDLALSGEALSALPDPAEDSEERQEGGDAQEVADLLKRNSRPRLSVAIPSPPPQAGRERSASGGSSLSRKRIPPALDLAPSLPNVADTAGLGTDDSNMRLAYLTEESTPSTGTFAEGDDSSDGETTQRPRRSPLEEKRDGQFFDDLNLGLDGSVEYDEDDPDDRRKSQVLMMAKLDEIEKHLAQFSPRKLAIEDLAAETSTGMPSIASLTPPPNWQGTPRSAPIPMSPHQPGPPAEGASWPAVPYSMLNNMNNSAPEIELPSDVPSPPRIAFNGISTELPKSPFQKRFTAHGDAMSDESLARKRELEEEGLYPPLVAPALLRTPGSESPVIPLSPDPFGRFPSDLDVPTPRYEESVFAAKQNSSLRQAHSSKMSNASSAPSTSRFSIDSLASEDGKAAAKQSSLMSVKSIKKLWRRTNKASVSGSSSPALPNSGRSSPNSAPPSNGPAPRPGPKRISRTLSRSPLLPEPPKSAPGPAMLMPKRNGSMHQLSWNQESPYPLHPPPPRQPSPAVSPIPATTPPLPASAPPALNQAEKGGMRKSILKSFSKSQSGTLSAHSSQSSISAPRSSNEMPTEPQRLRKGSVVELGQVMKRASGVSSTMTLVDIPRSPPLPEHLSGNQSRSASRSSQLSNASMRMKNRPSISSTESSSSRAPSRLMAGASPPRPGALSIPRTSGDSSDSRPSFDESQFEIVSPKLLPHQLSYPYNTIDQSMSSSE